jgi:hypothetical protein
VEEKVLYFMVRAEVNREAMLKRNLRHFYDSEKRGKQKCEE